MSWHLREVPIGEANQEQIVPRQPTVVLPSDRARRAGNHRRHATLLVAATLATAAAPARAVDGCLLLLCLAAPSWRAVSQCVPPVTQALRDLARGRPFPTCAMSGPGNSASHQWASAPSYCPVQYTHAVEVEGVVTYSCDFSGAVSVFVDGTMWSRTWWRMDGATATEFSEAAKATMGSWDTQFESDYAAWLASQPPPPPPCPTC